MTHANKMQIGLVQFPGSNCDQDCIDVFKQHFGMSLRPIWHTETQLPKVDGLILPGGFSYGDYLRSGALAAHSPVMDEVRQFAAKGGPVIGICNGFQVLTETRLLPGALLKNNRQKFICRFVALKGVNEGSSPYSKILGDHVYRLPVAHGQGRYYSSDEDLRRLQGNGQIVIRYSSVDGDAAEEFNPNGSSDNIAGIVSENGRVFGLMPHPERATNLLLGGSADGLKFWEAFLAACG